VLNWWPHYTFTLPETTDAFYVYRLRVLSWSYISTETKSGAWSALAEAPDALGQVGCRPGPTPSDDSSGLAGCVYDYSPTPSVPDMIQTFWSEIRPRAMDQRVYTYHLPDMEPIYITTRVKYVVDVMYASNPNGSPAIAGTPQDVTKRFTVNFVIPRSAR